MRCPARPVTNLSRIRSRTPNTANQLTRMPLARKLHVLGLVVHKMSFSRRLLIALLSLVPLGCRGPAERKLDSAHPVAIVYPVTVDALLKIGIGAEQVLRPKGFITKAFSAEGDAGKFASVLEAALSTQPTVLISVGTQMTDTALGPKYTGKLPPLVATAIFDPNRLEGLGNVNINPPRGKNLAIISDQIDNEGDRLYELLTSLLPAVKKIGILSNSGEENSVASAHSITAVLERHKLVSHVGYLASPADLTPVTRDLLGRGVEALIIPHDKIAVSQAGVVVELALHSKTPVPVFSLDDGTVEKQGVLACISADYQALGRNAGDLALQAISGKSLSGTPIVHANVTLTVINNKSAQRLGITVPAALQTTARFVE